MHIFQGIFLFLFGLVLWTLLEYAVHRWLFHGVLSKYHRHHHDAPTVPRPIPLWALAIPLLAIFWLSTPLGLGVLTGLVIYEAVHVYIHHGVSEHPWLLKLHARHLEHHRNPHLNYGLTTNIWDRVFKTLKGKA